MEDEILLDSNILVYAYDIDAGEKHIKAKALLEKCFKGEKDFIVSLQNLNEFYTIVTSKIETPLDKETAFERIKNMLSFHGLKILIPTPQTIFTAIHLNITSNMPYWDCFIAATMLENKVFHIYTENTKDFSFPGVIAENPFL